MSLVETSFNKPFIIGSYSVVALNSLHDLSQQSQIYLITQYNKTLLYGTDLLSIDSAYTHFLSNRNINIDLLILDQTYGAGYNAGGHLDAKQVVDIINLLRDSMVISDKTLIYATHISHEGNFIHEKTQQIANKYGYNVAYDGLYIR